LICVKLAVGVIWTQTKNKNARRFLSGRVVVGLVPLLYDEGGEGDASVV